tara:strand:- start:41 stop:739 length:699 start_codon:yes stop_codon:yes gene_type:complete
MKMKKFSKQYLKEDISVIKKYIFKNFIIISFIFSSSVFAETKYLSEENKEDQWTVDVLVIDDKPVDVIASVNGKITHGDRLRIKIPIVDESWCDSGQLFTTFYTTINNPSIEELKGKTILGTARYKKVNPITEKINFRVAISIKSMLGDLVFLDMGTYDIDFLKRLKKMEQLTIELQDGVEIKVSDYFDIPKNTFFMDGVNNALDRARAECLKIVKENDIVKLGLKKINNEN